VHGNDSSARGDHSQNKQNSYQLSNRAGSQGPERALGGHHGAHNAKVYSGASRHGVVLDRDNTSEETILRETKVERDFGDVVCQTEISIKYSGRNAGRNFV
jgi:hypothetical protein